MKTILVVLLFALQGPVPVDQEPRHTVRFADDALRVLDVDILPGDTTLEHMHLHDLATVCLECAPTRTHAPGAAWGDVRTRAVGSAAVTEYTAAPAAHTVQNLSAVERYHLIAVENLHPGGSPGGPPPGLTPSQETGAFRIYEFALAPGAAVPTHTHAAPTVLVTPGSGEWTVIRAGQAHDVVAGGRATRLVEIELK